MYAVIDVETTGLKPAREKITEIAVVLTDGYTIEREWHTLLNPERPIPAQITRMTGITNEMVADAPRFYEIARELVLMTEGRTFVAHNVNFDYNFVRQEFNRLGYDYRRRKKCTVQWSRRLFPGYKSYGLGKLSHALGIENNARHRAAGDAKATAELLHKIILKQDTDKQEIPPAYLPPAMDMKTFQALPAKTGVYYFLDEKQRILYVGKSLNIKERVKSHFASPEEREQKMKLQTAHVGYEITGSELVALLLESHEIKKHTPVFNRQQRRNTYNYGLFSYYDEKGYLHLQTAKITGSHEPHTTFSTAREAKEHLRNRVEQYFLCQKLSGLYKSRGACFQYQVHQCLGACIGEESPDTYNKRVEEMLKNYDLQYSDLMIIDPGRNEQEYSLVVVRNNTFLGFGYFDKHQEVSRENMLDLITEYDDNKDVRRIIRTYIKQNKPLKVVDL